MANHNQINDSMLNSLLQEQSHIEEELKTQNIMMPEDSKEDRDILEALNQPL